MVDRAGEWGLYITTYASRIAGQAQILEAASGSITTAYLYGLSPLGEFGSQSVNYLTDGTGSVRQLADPSGAVKLARMYEPFGQVLLQKGSSDPTYGYLGVQVDRITGLLYIDGGYYDPVTGRFLSPNSGGSNPYVPLSGVALAPILILALLGRWKKGKIWTGWVVIALLMSVGLTLVSCDGKEKDNKPPQPPTISPSPSPSPSPNPAPSPTPFTFSKVDDYQRQFSELVSYVTGQNLPHRVVQGDLNSLVKHYQYNPGITNLYGYNACGPVAAAGAFGGENWEKLAAQIIGKAQGNYGPDTGIQPDPFAQALSDTFGAGNVQKENEWTLGGMYQQLRAGNIVIVDIKVQAHSEIPSASSPNFAHFARVLGIDLDMQQIYIENTLTPPTSSYWTVSLSNFWEVWKFPERDVSSKPPKVDVTATRWAVIIRSGAQPLP